MCFSNRITPQIRHGQRSASIQERFVYIQERAEDEELPSIGRVPINERLWFVCLRVSCLCCIAISVVFGLTIVPGFYTTKALIRDSQITFEEVWEYYRFTFLVVSYKMQQNSQ